MSTAVPAPDAQLPIGTPVRYWTGWREGDGKASRTRTEVHLLGGHTLVVWVEGERSCIAVTHVERMEAGLPGCNWHEGGRDDRDRI